VAYSTLIRTTVSSLTNYPAGYLDRDLELIVGLQTACPLKRGVNPFGGIRMAQKACQDYGYKLSETVLEHFRYRTTHNDGVFRVYTPEMKAVRKTRRFDRSARCLRPRPNDR